MFRKPKKIQRRVFCADDDEDGEPEPPPPPIISHERPKPVKSTPQLSFADEGKLNQSLNFKVNIMCVNVIIVTKVNSFDNMFYIVSSPIFIGNLRQLNLIRSH